VQLGDILLIVIFVAIGICVAYMIYSKKRKVGSDEIREMVQKNKTEQTIFVIDKQYCRPTENNVPKAMYEKITKGNRMRKIGIVKAKLGPKIMTFMCNKDTFNVLPDKKSVKVECAGLYIIGIVGMNLRDKKKKSIKDRLLIDYLGR